MLGEGLVHRPLELHDLAPPPAAIGRHDDLGRRVVHTVADGLRRKAAEDDAVGRPHAGAGEHRHRQLRHHRHVEHHPVAGHHTQRLQRVGEAADLGVELAVGQRAPVARLSLPDDRALVLRRRAEVAVEAVLRHIQLAAHKPLRVGELPVQHRLPRRVPEQQLLRLRRPEPLGVGLSGGIEFAIGLHAPHARRRRKGLWRCEEAVFFEDGLKVLAHGAVLREAVTREAHRLATARLSQGKCRKSAMPHTRLHRTHARGKTRNLCYDAHWLASNPCATHPNRHLTSRSSRGTGRRSSPTQAGSRLLQPART